MKQFMTRVQQCLPAARAPTEPAVSSRVFKALLDSTLLDAHLSVPFWYSLGRQQQHRAHSERFEIVRFERRQQEQSSGSSASKTCRGRAQNGGLACALRQTVGNELRRCKVYE